MLAGYGKSGNNNLGRTQSSWTRNLLPIWITWLEGLQVTEWPRSLTFTCSIIVIIIIIQMGYLKLKVAGACRVTQVLNCEKNVKLLFPIEALSSYSKTDLVILQGSHIKDWS